MFTVDNIMILIADLAIILNERERERIADRYLCHQLIAKGNC